MKGKKATKRALLSSALSLVLCFSMLLGTTFAWFTDEASTKVNTIQSGTLEVVLEYWDGDSWENAEDKTLDFIKAADAPEGETLLWEPGCTYKLPAIRVGNAGNLWLKYEIVITGIDGDAKLNEAIEWTYNGEAASAFAGFEGTLAPADGENKNYGDYEDGIVISGHMKEDAGNEYQDLSIEGIAITVFATQKDAEFDSFDNKYDENATIGTPIYTTDEFYAALAEGTGAVCLNLMSDDIVWTTGASHGSTPLVAADSKITSLTINGNDHKLTFDGDGVGSVRAANGAKVTFNDVNFVDKSVSYAEDAWEFTYLEFAGALEFNDCTFNSGIQLQTEGEETALSATFTDCKFITNEESVYAVWVSDGVSVFENCTFTGTRGLKAHEDYGSEIVSVTIDNCFFGPLSKKPGVTIGDVNEETTISITECTFAGTQAGDGETDSTKGVPYVYETDTAVDTFTFVYDAADNATADYAADNDALKNAIANDAYIVLGSDTEYTLPTLKDKEGITIEGAADGSTVIGGENASTGFGSNFGTDTTIKNVTFSGNTNGVRSSYANGGTSTFENCTFAGDSTYGFHIDESKGATFIFNDCTFIGFNAFAGDLESVTFNDCTFLSNGSYGHTNIWSNGYFNNCTWGDETSVGTRGDNAHLYFNNVEESYHHEYIGSAESLVAFAESVNEGEDSWSGQKILLIDDIDLAGITWTPIGQTGATEFRGIFDGQNHTIKNLNVDNSDKTDEHTSSGLFGWAESGVTIQNVKVDGANVKGNHNVAVIVGYTYSGKISNCHVTNATIVCNHANGDACGDKAGLIAGYAADESRISGCSASNSTVTAGRDAGQLIGCGYNVSVSDCSATNVTVSATGNCSEEANINAALIGRVMA